MKQKFSFKYFIKTSGIFFVGSVLSKAISILLLPLYTNKIPTAEMGYYDLSLTYITIATSMLFFDIWVAILRYMYDGKGRDDKASIIRSGLMIFVASCVVYILLGGILGISLHIESIGWILIYGLSSNISQLFTFCARGFGKNIEFAISGIINTVVNVIANVLLIVIFEMNYVAMYISAVLGFFAQIAYLSVTTDVLKALIKGKFDKYVCKSMFRYSLPLCLNSVAYWILSSFNRIVLNSVYGNEINGIYAIGNKFSFIIAMATTCFTYAWQDISFSKAEEVGSNGRFYSNACNLYIQMLGICTCLALPVLKIIFPLLVGTSYSAAEATIPLFLVNAMIAAVSTFIGNVFYAIKDTKAIFISMVISALFNLGVGYSLIKLWSINGANIAVILSFFLNIVIRSVILKKKINFQLGKDMYLVIGAMLISSVVFIKYNVFLNIILFVVIAGVCLLIYREAIKNITRCLIKGKE